jgi:hypothetical protein
MSLSASMLFDCLGPEVRVLYTPAQALVTHARQALRRLPWAGAGDQECAAERLYNCLEFQRWRRLMQLDTCGAALAVARVTYWSWKRR